MSGVFMTKWIDCATLRSWLSDGAELALFDVREHGQFGESHLFHAVSLPYSRLELDAVRLAPRKGVRMVLLDDDNAVALRAAHRLADAGYANVHILRGGNIGWKAAGNVLFSGVNVASKAFGEMAEHHYRTPSLSAHDLAEMFAKGQDVVVLDSRPYDEYRRMSIPGAICCPNGELGLRLHDLVADERTPIVVNCAGRTRSIIGAQTLINLGVRNPVYALRNGTMGWALDNLKLEYGGARRHPVDDPPARLEDARRAAAALAQRTDVRSIDARTLESWFADDTRSTFLCDLRTPEEFARGSLPCAQHTPGGQLIQATDQYIGVRHARLVLLDADGVRAPIVASWLRQMGHDAVVLEGGVHSGFKNTPAPPIPVEALPEIGVADCAAQIAAGALAAIDLGPSMQFRTEHVPGAIWSIRPRIAAQVREEHRPIVFLCDEPPVAALAALELVPEQRVHARLLRGGLRAWKDAGLAVASSSGQPADSDCIDYLFFVHDRHNGNMEAARRYLAWETGLIDQMEDHERAAFSFAAPPKKETAHD